MWWLANKGRAVGHYAGAPGSREGRGRSEQGAGKEAGLVSKAKCMIVKLADKEEVKKSVAGMQGALGVSAVPRPQSGAVLAFGVKSGARSGRQQRWA